MSDVLHEFVLQDADDEVGGDTDARPVWGRDIDLVLKEKKDLKGRPLNLAEKQDGEPPYLVGAHLEGADLHGAHLEGAHLSGAHLDEADLSGAHLEKALFVHEKWGTKIVGEYFKVQKWTGAAIEEHLGVASLRGACLHHAHLAGAVLFMTHLEGADLRNAVMQGATLCLAHLEGAYLLDAHLEGANLFLAHLEGAHLRRARLDGAFLRQALIGPLKEDVKRCGLDCCDVRLGVWNPTKGTRATLVDATLKPLEEDVPSFLAPGGIQPKGTAANLSLADIRMARFHGADITNVKMENVIFTPFRPPPPKPPTHPAALREHAKAIGGKVATGLYQAVATGAETDYVREPALWRLMQRLKTPAILLLSMLFN